MFENDHSQMSRQLANGEIESLINTLVGDPRYKQFINSKDGIRIQRTMAFHRMRVRYKYTTWVRGHFRQDVFSAPPVRHGRGPGIPGVNNNWVER